MEILNMDEIRGDSDDYEKAELDITYSNVCQLSRYFPSTGYYNYRIWHIRYGIS